MTAIISEIAIPPPTGPQFDFHRKRRISRHQTFRTQLVQHRFKGNFNRRGDLDLFADLKRFDYLLLRESPFSVELSFARFVNGQHFLIGRKAATLCTFFDPAVS